MTAKPRSDGTRARAARERREVGPPPRLEWKTVLFAALTALAGQAIAWTGILVLFNVLEIGYGFYDVTDTPIYFGIAKAIAAGHRPYADFALAYPPLAVPLFLAPLRLWSVLGPLSRALHLAGPDAGAPGQDLVAYSGAYAAAMIVLCAITAVVTSLTAASIWRDRGRVVLASALFAAAVLATGAVIANRYDVAVALVFAAATFLMTRRAWTGAALVLGLGFALKLTPAILMPVVLVLAGTRREAVVASLAFVVAAAAPFLPALAAGAPQLSFLFTSLMVRPLQVETLLATPIWIAHLANAATVRIETAFGSQYVTGPGSTVLAAAAPVLAVVALLAVYALVWRRRATLRAEPSAIPLAVAAVIVAFLAFAKVLSPQFMIWLIPCVPLVALDSAPLGALLLATLLMTQVEFPSRYWQFIAMERTAVLVVVVRNVLLLATLIASIAALWRLPPPPEKARPR